MAHHPFPARLRIPTQNVGTSGIRGFQQTDRVASFHSFERRSHPRLFAARKASPSRTEHPAGKVRRTSPDGRTDTEIRRARRVPNTVTSPKTGCTTLFFTPFISVRKRNGRHLRPLVPPPSFLFRPPAHAVPRDHKLRWPPPHSNRAAATLRTRHCSGRFHRQGQ